MSVGCADKCGGKDAASKTSEAVAKADRGAKADKAKAAEKDKAAQQAQAQKKDIFNKDTFTPASLKTCPVTGPIISPMGSRTHPVTGERLGHKGVDIAVPTGTPVKATHDGRVTVSDFQMDRQKGTGYGNYVVVEGDNVKTVSAHLSERSVQQGQQVRAGDIIGLSGATGGVTGPHLHIETHERTATGWSLANPRDVFERSGLDCEK